MGPGDNWEDGMWQIINNHLSHRFPCFAVWQTTGCRQGAASSASQDAAAAATTHMWPQCSGADFLHSRSILLIRQWNKQKRQTIIVQVWGELCSVKEKETEYLQRKAELTTRLMRKADMSEEGGAWSNEKVNENQKLVCIVMCVIYLKINNHLTR